MADDRARGPAGSLVGEEVPGAARRTADRAGAPRHRRGRRGRAESPRQTADLLLLSDLEAQCTIGVSDEEQEHPQPIWIDLELAIDARRAAERDDVNSAVDYGRLVTVVREKAQGAVFCLLETLAEELAALILQEFQVPTVRVRVKKRALPGIAFAAVEITRGAQGGRRP